MFLTKRCKALPFSIDLNGKTSRMFDATNNISARSNLRHISGSDVCGLAPKLKKKMSTTVIRCYLKISTIMVNDIFSIKSAEK